MDGGQKDERNEDSTGEGRERGRWNEGRTVLKEV